MRSSDERSAAEVPPGQAGPRELARLRDEVARAGREIERRDAELARLGQLLVQVEDDLRDQLAQARTDACASPRPAQPVGIIAALLRALLRAGRGRWPVQAARVRRKMRAVQRTGLFDAAWYRSVNADVREGNLDPLRHFVLHEIGEGRPPNAGPLSRRSPTARSGPQDRSQDRSQGRSQDGPT